MTQGRRSPRELSQSRPPVFVRALPSTAELSSWGYERWFDPLYAYVSRHVAGRQVRERIVREVLSEHLDLLVGRRDEGMQVRRLEATADRLIAEAVRHAELFLDRRRQERFSRERRHADGSRRRRGSL